MQLEFIVFEFFKTLDFWFWIFNIKKQGENSQLVNFCFVNWTVC